LIWKQEVATRVEAVKLEKKIKMYGAKRFLLIVSGSAR
jgi:predicted GIY-YIG superfamily endonuclease